MTDVPARAGDSGRARAKRSALAARARSITEPVVAARLDLAIVVTLTALAAVLRLWRLATVPLGLHGDEALTGLDAQRILREGWIGPYVFSALGQPSGPLYFTALLFSFLPDTTYTVRLSMSLFGIATIPLAYLAFAEMFNRRVAAFSALILGLMMWHIHLGHVGYMVQSWPFIEMLALWLLFVALRRRSIVITALAGGAAGLGIYSYNAYMVFVPVLAVPFIWHAMRLRQRDDRTALMGRALVYVATALIVALPMLHYVANHNYEYTYHQEVVAVHHADEWKEAGIAGKAELLGERGWEWLKALVRGDRPDLGDGLASPGRPVVDSVTFVLAVAGIGFAAARARDPAHAVVLAAVIFLPFGAILTVGDGLFRRTYGIVPFIAVLAALPLAWAWDLSARRRDVIGYAACAALVAGVALAGARNVREYFGPVQDDPWVRFVFPHEFDAASRYMAGLPEGTHVYLYSDRWGFDYETRRFLAPDAEGTDRSREFRPRSGAGNRGAVLLEVPEEGDATLIFMGRYLPLLETAAGLNPGGTITEGEAGGEVAFRAYELDR